MQLNPKTMPDNYQAMLLGIATELSMLLGSLITLMMLHEFCSVLSPVPLPIPTSDSGVTIEKLADDILAVLGIDSHSPTMEVDRQSLQSYFLKRFKTYHDA